MKSGRMYALSGLLVSLLMGALLVWHFAAADPVSGGTAATAPANGTAESFNITFQAQQLVGYYGNVSMRVLKTDGGSTGVSLYNRSVATGSCVFVQDANAVADPAFTTMNQSAPDGNADGNFSVSGAYNTVNHFTTVVNTLCGEQGIFSLNTTDNYAVGIFRSGSGANPINGTNAVHFVGGNIVERSSTNGFGLTLYQIIVPKTAIYGDAGYDFFVEQGNPVNP